MGSNESGVELVLQSDAMLHTAKMRGRQFRVDPPLVLPWRRWRLFYANVMCAWWLYPLVALSSSAEEGDFPVWTAFLRVKSTGGLSHPIFPAICVPHPFSLKLYPLGGTPFLSQEPTGLRLKAEAGFCCPGGSKCMQRTAHGARSCFFDARAVVVC